jgi:Icc-related predicted phosphoesterase
MSIIGFIGDVHSNFDGMFNIIKAHPEVKRWFQIGDLGAEDETYPDFPSNFHFIQGNHENWNYLEELKKTNNPLFLKNGSMNQYTSSGISYNVCVLGGNYSSKFYLNKTASLCGDRRRHFTAEEYQHLISYKTETDILLTHEAPKPFFKGGKDIGNQIVTDLIKALKPSIHVYGHHHMFQMGNINGILSVGLDFVTKSYVLYDFVTKEVRKIVP